MRGSSLTPVLTGADAPDGVDERGSVVLLFSHQGPGHRTTCNAACRTRVQRPEWLVANMTRLRVPQSWIFSLGALKAAGALGLLAGIGLPMIGIAAAAGLVLFFVGAIVTALHAHWYAHISYPATFLVLAVASLVLRLGSL